MNENDLTATQISLILGATVTVTAVLVGLGLRKIEQKRKGKPSIGSGKTILEIAEDL